MSNPTTPFSWQMPTSTDLVTDLPADFEVFGQAVATSMQDLLGGTTGQVLAKASNADMDFVWSADAAGMTNPMTTTGDTIYSSPGSTPVRRAIGTTGQVLTVSGGVPTWATPGSGLTLVSRSSFSSVATTTTTFDNVFSSTYAQYMIVIENMFCSSGGASGYFQWRVGGSTQAGGNYLGAAFGYATGGPGLTTININGTQGTLSYVGGTAISGLGMNLVAAQVGASGRPQLWGSGMDSANNLQINTGFYYGITIAADGFILSASAGNISGTVAIYGMAK